MIYGFSPMTAGHLTVFGLDIRHHMRTIKTRIGVCQQENNLDPDLTVLENLMVFARYFNISRRPAMERLKNSWRLWRLTIERNPKSLIYPEG